MISRLRFAHLNHVHGCAINRPWLAAVLPVLRNWLRFRGIADMAGLVAGTTRALMRPNPDMKATYYRSLVGTDLQCQRNRKAKSLGSPSLRSDVPVHLCPPVWAGTDATSNHIVFGASSKA
jgi:hypothetical protein